MDCVPTDLHGYLRQTGQLSLRKPRKRFISFKKILGNKNDNQLYEIESQVWFQGLTQKLSELELQKQKQKQKTQK